METKTDTRTKDKFIILRVPKAIKDKVIVLCKLQRVSISDFIRDLLMKL